MAPPNRRLEKLSFPGPSAGRGGLLILLAFGRGQHGFGQVGNMPAIGREELTLVRATPQLSPVSNLGGAGAGVSMNWMSSDSSTSLDLVVMVN